MQRIAGTIRAVVGGTPTCRSSRRAVSWRCHRSSASVQPGTFTFSHERVIPPRYGLASSLPTQPSYPRSRTAAQDLQAVRRESTHRQHEVAAGDEVLQPGTTITQGARAQVAAVLVQHVESHEERRRRHGVWIWVAQPVEARPELLVEDRYLIVEHQRLHGKARNGGDQIGEALAVVHARAADEAHGLAVPGGQHAIAVDLLLIDPAGRGGRVQGTWVGIMGAS
jgi:hypothetical protein